MAEYAFRPPWNHDLPLQARECTLHHILIQAYCFSLWIFYRLITTCFIVYLRYSVLADVRILIIALVKGFMCLSLLYSNIFQMATAMSKGWRFWCNEISLSVIWGKNHSDLAGFSNSLGLVMDLKKQKQQLTKRRVSFKTALDWKDIQNGR